MNSEICLPFLCDSPEDYKKKLSELKFMPETDFKQFCSNALKSITDFNMESYCSSLLAFYENRMPVEQVYKNASTVIEEIV